MKKLNYISDHLKTSIKGSNYNRVDSDWFYFLHIPKTAGTTFRFVLYDYFEQAEIYPNYYELTVKQKSQYLGWKAFREKEGKIFHAGKRLLIAHYGWAAVKHFKKHPPRVITFLRDPVKRVKSTILYHQKPNRMYAGMSIDEIVDQYALREGALQARQLGYRPKKDNIQRALKNLESIDFVGISEQFDDSLRLCNQTLGWSLEPIPKRNVGSYDMATFTQEQLEKIIAACELDNILYERGKELFIKRCAEHGI